MTLATLFAVDDGLMSGNANLADILFLAAFVVAIVAAIVAWIVLPRSIVLTLISVAIAWLFDASLAVLRDCRRVLQFLRLVVGHDVVEQLLEVAVQYIHELVGREVDPVVGDSALRKVVSANLL